MDEADTMHREMAPADIHSLVDALLDGIGRGELDASPREVEFLRSVSNLLRSASPSIRRSTASV